MPKDDKIKIQMWKFVEDKITEETSWLRNAIPMKVGAKYIIVPNDDAIIEFTNIRARELINPNKVFHK